MIIGNAAILWLVYARPGEGTRPTSSTKPYHLWTECPPPALLPASDAGFRYRAAMARLSKPNSRIRVNEGHVGWADPIFGENNSS